MKSKIFVDSDSNSKKPVNAPPVDNFKRLNTINDSSEIKKLIRNSYERPFSAIVRY